MMPMTASTALISLISVLLQQALVPVGERAGSPPTIQSLAPEHGQDWQDANSGSRAQSKPPRRGRREPECVSCLSAAKTTTRFAQERLAASGSMAPRALPICAILDLVHRHLTVP